MTPLLEHFCVSCGELCDCIGLRGSCDRCNDCVFGPITEEEYEWKKLFDETIYDGIPEE